MFPHTVFLRFRPAFKGRYSFFSTVCVWITMREGAYARTKVTGDYS